MVTLKCSLTPPPPPEKKIREINNNEKLKNVKSIIKMKPKVKLIKK